MPFVRQLVLLSKQITGISDFLVILYDLMSLLPETFLDSYTHISLPIIQVGCPTPEYFQHPVQISIIALNCFVCAYVAISPLHCRFLTGTHNIFKFVISAHTK